MLYTGVLFFFVFPVLIARMFGMRPLRWMLAFMLFTIILMVGTALGGLLVAFQNDGWYQTLGPEIRSYFVLNLRHNLDENGSFFSVFLIPYALILDGYIIWFKVNFYHPKLLLIICELISLKIIADWIYVGMKIGWWAADEVRSLENVKVEPTREEYLAAARWYPSHYNEQPPARVVELRKIIQHHRERGIDICA